MSSHFGIDRCLCAIDGAMRTLFVAHKSAPPCPTLAPEASELSRAEQKQAAALMRVNHVGEVCAQALYSAQALVTQSDALRQHFVRAGHEEGKHLAWTEMRLRELAGRTSMLNPVWYAGAFGIGLLAGRLGDALSLGFVMASENQVEAHLAQHLERLPVNDHASRAIVAQMKDDEAAHALAAQALGAAELAKPWQQLMRLAAKLMTTVAYRI